MSGAPLVSAHGLAAGYGRADHAISQVTFSVEPGQTVAVLGPNGGGKTTLFRALLGQLRARSGDLDVTGRLGYVAQTERSRLDFPVNVLDVALMGLYGRTPWYRRIGAAERRTAAEAIERVGLGASARTPYGQLSGGQRQRVLIARALAQDADVLLLDEPLSGLDRTSAEAVLGVLEDLRAEGAALLVATHDVNQARRSDKVLCLNGAQVAYGTPGDVLTGPVLADTYGAEIVVLEGGERAVAIQHHAH